MQNYSLVFGKKIVIDIENDGRERYFSRDIFCEILEAFKKSSEDGKKIGHVLQRVPELKSIVDKEYPIVISTTERVLKKFDEFSLTEEKLLSSEKKEEFEEEIKSTYNFSKRVSGMLRSVLENIKKEEDERLKRIEKNLTTIRDGLIELGGCGELVNETNCLFERIKARNISSEDAKERLENLQKNIANARVKRALEQMEELYNRKE